MLLGSYVCCLALLENWNLGWFCWSPWEVVCRAVEKLMLGRGEEKSKSSAFFIHNSNGVQSNSFPYALNGTRI